MGFYGFMKGFTKYGSVGLALEEPFYKIEVRKGEGNVRGCQSTRARTLLERVIEYFGTSRKYDVRILSCIPAHSGLGSTTQLALSIYAGIAILEGQDHRSIIELAAAAGRGRFSGAGTLSFIYGGLVVDTGKLADEAPRLLTSIRIPRRWGIVVVIPSYRGKRFVEDEAEYETTITAMERAGELVEEKATYLVFRKLIPALVHRDLASFADAVEELDILNAHVFYKGDKRFCCQEAEEASRALRELGIIGIGQSSWGPAIYGFYDRSKLKLSYTIVKEAMMRRGVEVDKIYITRAANHGATIVVKS
ncbi:MAG: hypothetical protein ABWW69_03955 [Pyrodictiaceae archaeon]